jgi:hypothetical protein
LIVEFVRTVFGEVKSSFLFRIWKEYFACQRGIRRRQDGDGIRKNYVVFVKRKLLFQNGSFDLSF